MEPTYNEQSVENPSNLSSLFLFPMCFLISCLLGYWIGAMVFKPSMITKGYEIPKTLPTYPIPLDHLQNPMFSLWSARVEGVVTEKSDTSFTLSQEQNQSKINRTVGLTKVYKSVTDATGEKSVEVPYEDLPLNSRVTGVVIITDQAGVWALEGKLFDIL